MTIDISVVLPMFNESASVNRVLSAVAGELQALPKSYEIICVNDGSSDDTGDRLDAAAAGDSRVVVMHLSRNFGKEAALAAGMDAALGRAVLFLDADLQHPVGLIPNMVACWEKGYDVVDAVKAQRGPEPLAYRLAARAFYGLMGRHAGAQLRDSSDFKLLDRQVVDALAVMPERVRFFRGLVAWVGFKVARLPFDVLQRSEGASRWRLSELARYALRNIVSFTSFPLRLVAWVGLVTLVAEVLLGVQTLWNWWRGEAVTGFTTVILIVLGLGGLMLLSIGVVAVYLAQLYDEQKARPIYVVRRPRPHRAAGQPPP